jgi:glycosyltransferase involved in cell wall biosynthesis
MPAYNAGKYIGEALDSVLAQTFTDWECIVVDDCSIDDTAEIIKKYATWDARIKYHKLDKNSGSAKVPRDTAIAMAKGQWIMALDADDVIAPNVLQSLAERQKVTGADMVLLRMTFADSKCHPTGEILPSSEFDMTRIMTGKNAAMLTIGEWTIGLNGLVKRTLYDACHSIGNHMNADEYTSRELLFNSTLMAFADVAYYYRWNPESVSKKFSSKIFDTIITDWALIGLVEEYFGKGSYEFSKTEAVFHHRLLHYVSGYGRAAHKLDDKECKHSWDVLCKHRGLTSRWKILRSKGLPVHEKIALMLPLSAIGWLARIVLGAL